MKRSHDDMAVDGGEESSDDSVIITGSRGPLGLIPTVVTTETNKRRRRDVHLPETIMFATNGLILARYPIVNGKIIFSKATRGFYTSNIPPMPPADSIVHKHDLQQTNGTMIIMYSCVNRITAIDQPQSIFFHAGDINPMRVCQCDIRLPLILDVEKAYYQQIQKYARLQKQKSDSVPATIVSTVYHDDEHKARTLSVTKQASATDNRSQRPTTAIIAVVSVESSVATIPPPAPHNPFYVKR